MECKKCGLPKDLCVCAEIEKENTRVAVGVGRRDGALVKQNRCIKCGNIPTGIGYYKNDTTGEIICLDCVLGVKKPPTSEQKVTNALQLLDEIEKAELQNYDTAKAMPKDNPMRNELMAHAWGRIKLARLVRKRLTQ